MKLFKIILVILVLIFAGCAERGVQELEPGATNYVLHYEDGTVLSIKPVVIKDNGNGAFIGSLIGAVLGSTVGRGRGSVLASLAGGLGGAYVGSQAGKANAQELTVQPDDANTEIIVIVKGTKHYIGEHVRIVKRGAKVISVEEY